MTSTARPHVGLLACAVWWTTLAAPNLASAQPVVDLALSDAQLASKSGCAILKINFNIRIRYASHFPLAQGQELRITLNPIDRDQAIALQLLKREAIRVPDNKLAAIKAIDFETRQTGGPVLRILFDHPVAYRVAQSSDIQSVIVAISGPTPSAACKAEYPAGVPGLRATAVPGDGTTTARATAPTRPMDRPSGKISDADLRAAAAAMDEARAALKKNNPGSAVQLFTKVLKYPENEYSAEAQEFLGLARQRSGQIEAAKAEYEGYLRRYPAGEGSERVRQRLDGIVTARGEPAAALRGPSEVRTGKQPYNKFAKPGETSWTLSGSVSEFYIRDDSFRTARDPTLAPNPTDDPDSHQVHQNEMLTSVDLMATWTNDQTRGKVRFSGTEEHRFDRSPNDRAGVAALFAEAEIKDWDVLGRLGRQTRASDGVLGRFDGALLSFQPLPYAKFNLVGGSPVLSRFDMPFRDQKYFYGTSLNLGPFLDGLETSVYAIEQRDRSVLDRRSVGTELRYFDQTKTMFATADYDMHFRQLNAAIFSGSWTLPDKSTIYGGADYRRTPFLSMWNAILNQPFTTLYDIMKFQSAEQLQQLAVSQTPIYKSAMIGYSRPLNDHFQVSADATVVNLSQPIAPTDATLGLASLPAGNEYYFSTQLIGSNLVKDGDMYIGGLRYSQLTNSNMYALDFNSRYPLFPSFIVSPRLRLGYRSGRGIDLKEYTAMPSLLFDYYWTKELNFEFEIGAQQNWTTQNGIKDRNSELFITLGLRYDFYADDTTRASDRAKCATPVAAALCRYSIGVDKGNCASPPTTCR
jgi:hypothetical protein